MEDFVKKVESAVKKYNMFSRKDKVVVGVSGGPDSVCLLYFLHNLKQSLGLRLIVAHLNHKTRGRESDEDAKFVRKLASKLGIRCVVESKDVPKIAKINSISLEEAGRILRYDFLKRVCEEKKADKIALGHNGDDQAETVIMNILRGTGLTGLTGIPPVRFLEKGSKVKIVRPLIEVRKYEINEYLRKTRIVPREDKTNKSTRYLRNRIRLELIPYLNREYGWDIVSNLCRVAGILKNHQDFVDGFTSPLFRKMAKIKKNSVQLNVKEVVNLNAAIRAEILRKSIEYLKGDLKGITREHVNSVERMIDSSQTGSKVCLPDGIIVEKVYSKIVFSKGKVDKSYNFCYELKVPGVTRISQRGLSLEVKVIKHVSKKKMDGLLKGNSKAVLDYDKVKLPLIVRNRAEGDRITPLGMRGRKKIKDHFIDLKIPRQEREKLPLVVDSTGEVIWVFGKTISDKAKILPKTKDILVITKK